ncbi:MAG: ChuX/HutX family heme-like substrate-binding protein [Moheibacter sp.]
MNPETNDIRLRWEQLKSYHPELSPATAAEKLKVSEVELFQSAKGENLKILNDQFGELFAEIEKIEHFKILIRNKSCIQEINGSFKINSSQNGKLNIENETANLSIQISDLEYCFSIKSETENSFRFFDSKGSTVLRIITKPESDQKIFDEITEKFISKDQDAELKIEAAETLVNQTSPEINLQEFHSDWKNLDTIDDFQKILKKHNLTRWQAVHNAPDDFFAAKIKNRKVVNLLEETIEAEIPVRIYTENSCCIQSYHGEIENSSWHGSWFNVFAPDFGFHFDSSKVIESRIVRKPTNSGIISSIECFDGNDEMMFEIFCDRENDDPELNEWRALLNQFED